ncbi:ankyrin repeat-containing domain protein [Camillea tinctor]|nr:ankyrin repeat-containing domain protein [Camillea tinctor]
MTKFTDDKYWIHKALQAWDEDDDDAGLLDIFRLAKLNKHEELSRLLSEKPELVHIVNPLGDTLLHVACNSDAPNTASLLLRCGAEPNTRVSNMPPLHVSVKRNSIECTQLLLYRGADINALGGYGVRPLHYAVRKRPKANGDIFKFLIDAGASIETRSKTQKTVLHHFSCQETAAFGIDVLRERLKLILDVGDCGLLEARDDCGRTPILEAIQSKNHIALRVLLEAGAQTNIVDFNGFNILETAANWGTVEVLEVLKEAQITGVDSRTTGANGDRMSPVDRFAWQLALHPLYHNGKSAGPDIRCVKAFEELLRDIRDRAISTEIMKLEDIISKIKAGDLVPVKEELVQLTESKLEARINWEAETFRAVELDVRSGRTDLAIESLHEFMEESRKRLDVSPYDEEGGGLYEKIKRSWEYLGLTVE